MDENPKASSFSYENFRDFVRSDLPDGEAWDALVGEEHDFIRTRTSPLDKELEWLRWLLDGKPRLGFGVSWHPALWLSTYLGTKS